MPGRPCGSVQRWARKVSVPAKQALGTDNASDLLAEADQIDKDEDAPCGKHYSCYGLAAEMVRRESRLA